MGSQGPVQFYIIPYPLPLYSKTFIRKGVGYDIYYTTGLAPVHGLTDMFILKSLYIMLTRPCYVDPLNHYFYSKVKLVCFSFFDIQLKVKLVCFSLFVFRFSFFDIRIRAEYRILTFEILF